MNETLVQDARSGDAQAFAKLVEAYYRPIYGLAFSTVGNWQAAEDVAQDAFLVAWLNIAKLRTVDAFGAWLRRIARNLAFNWIRSELYRRALLERRGAFEGEGTPREVDADLVRADAVAESWAALEKLSPPLREAVVLFYMEENSIVQTANVLGITENAVKKRLQHARPQLRRFFEEQWKADMERERRRIDSQQAGRRFMAGVALGPVSTLAGKLGTGMGLGGLLRGVFSLDSAVVKPAIVALTVVAISGAGWFWHVNRQESVPGTAPRVAEVAKPASPVAQVIASKATPEVKREETVATGGTPERKPEPTVAATSAEKKVVRTVTVTGRVIDEEQNPVPGATVSVVVCGAETSPAKPAVAFGGGGAAGGTVMGGTGVGSGFGGGGAVGGTVSGGVTNGEEGEIAGGSIGGVANFLLTVPEVAPELPYEDTLGDTLRDETRRFSAKSAADGSFSIANVPDDGLLIISADALGCCRQGEIKNTTSGESTVDVTLTLSPGFPVEGRLLSTEGQPVTDALVQISALQWIREDPTTKWRSSGGWSGTPQYWAWRPTDSNGRFTLTSKDAGHATFSVRSKSQGKATFPNVPVGSGVAAELRYPRQSTVRGVITHRDGAPAPGVIVMLTGHVDTNQNGGRSSTQISGLTCKATTDATGTYEIARLDPQVRYTACLYDEGMAPLVTELDLEPLVAGQTLLWNYTLPQLTLVKGIATEHASGRPAVGVQIQCSPIEEVPEGGPSIQAPAAQASTGPDGAYEMRITTPPGEYAFGIPTLMGFRTLAQREVREGDTAVLNLSVPGTWTRSFLVVDSSGNPLSGVSVELQKDGSDYRFGIPDKTGDDGRVRVVYLVSGERVKCLFEYQGHKAESEILEGQEGMEFPEETMVIDLSK